MGYQETQESSFGKLGKFIGKIRKEIGSLGKFVWKNEVVRKVRPHIRKEKIKKKGPHLILVGKLGKLGPIRKIHWVNQEILSENQENYAKLGKNLQNQEKNCEIRKFLPNQESSLGKLGKIWKIGKIGKFHQEKQPDIRKVHPQYQESLG